MAARHWLGAVNLLLGDLLGLCGNRSSTRVGSNHGAPKRASSKAWRPRTSLSCLAIGRRSARRTFQCSCHFRTANDSGKFGLADRLADGGCEAAWHLLTGSPVSRISRDRLGPAGRSQVVLEPHPRTWRAPFSPCWTAALGDRRARVTAIPRRGRIRRVNCLDDCHQRTLRRRNRHGVALLSRTRISGGRRCDMTARGH